MTEQQLILTALWLMAVMHLLLVAALWAMGSRLERKFHEIEIRHPSEVKHGTILREVIYGDEGSECP